MLKNNFSEALMQYAVENIQKRHSEQSQKDNSSTIGGPVCELFSQGLKEIMLSEITKIIREHKEILSSEESPWDEYEIDLVKMYFHEGRDIRPLSGMLGRSEASIWKLIEELSEQGRL